MSISYDLSLVHEMDHREFYIPPTTHLVATIEDLTDMLDNASEEAEDMDDDIKH